VPCCPTTAGSKARLQQTVGESLDRVDLLAEEARTELPGLAHDPLTLLLEAAARHEDRGAGARAPVEHAREPRARRRNRVDALKCGEPLRRGPYVGVETLPLGLGCGRIALQVSGGSVDVLEARLRTLEAAPGGPNLVLPGLPELTARGPHRVVRSGPGRREPLPLGQEPCQPPGEGFCLPAQLLQRPLERGRRLDRPRDRRVTPLQLPDDVEHPYRKADNGTGSVRSRSYSSDNVLLAIALAVLIALVICAAATFTRHPLAVGSALVLALVGLALQAGAGDRQLTATVLLLLILGGLGAKAVGDLVGLLRPDRRPVERTRDEREAAARERRRRLAA
jgi:hypothetical protein